jgi:(2Fe-2S) ferredoxin
MAKRKNYLFVCINRRPDGTPKGSCAARGSEEIHARLKQGLKDRGLAGEVARACTSSCQDVCWVGPAIYVSSGGTGQGRDYVYGRVREADVEEILDGLERGVRVERLVLPPEDFLEPREKKKK